MNSLENGVRGCKWGVLLQFYLTLGMVGFLGYLLVSTTNDSGGATNQQFVLTAQDCDFAFKQVYLRREIEPDGHNACISRMRTTDFYSSAEPLTMVVSLRVIDPLTWRIRLEQELGATQNLAYDCMQCGVVGNELKSFTGRLPILRSDGTTLPGIETAFLQGNGMGVVQYLGTTDPVHYDLAFRTTRDWSEGLPNTLGEMGCMNFPAFQPQDAERVSKTLPNLPIVAQGFFQRAGPMGQSQVCYQLVGSAVEKVNVLVYHAERNQVISSTDYYYPDGLLEVQCEDMSGQVGNFWFAAQVNNQVVQAQEFSCTLSSCSPTVRQ